MHVVVKTLLQYSALTLLEKECYDVDVHPFRKTDYITDDIMELSMLLYIVLMEFWYFYI